MSITKDLVKGEHDEENYYEIQKATTKSTEQQNLKEDLDPRLELPIIFFDVLSTAQVPESPKATPISCDSKKYDTLVRTRSKNAANFQIDYMTVLRPTRTYSKLETVTTSPDSKRSDETKDQILGLDSVKKEKDNRKPINASEQTYSGSTNELVVYPHVFICEICSERFPTRTLFADHLNRIHTVETDRDYEAECYICKKRFSKKAYVKVHLLMHTGEKPFRCHICDKKFSQKGSLSAHLVFHREENNLTCSHCKRHFSNFERFNNHQNNGNRRAVKCKLCKIEYPNKCFKFHRDGHGVRPYECEFCGATFHINGTLYIHRQRKHIINQ